MRALSLKKSLYVVFVSIILLSILSLGVFFEILQNQKATVAKEAERYQSYLLADELRQSSDDLTRMARVYVVTGEPIFKKYFQDILDIRSGKKARPLKYHSIYWDFVLVRGRPKGQDGRAVALKNLMKKAGFVPREFMLLEKAERLSNELVSLEAEAMNAMVGIYKNKLGQYTIKRKPNLAYARKLLHGPEYHKAKERIMEPLGEFLSAIEIRTSKQVLKHREKRGRLSLVLLITMMTSIVLVLISFALIAIQYKTVKEEDKNTLFLGLGRAKDWLFAMPSLVVIFMIVSLSWYFMENIRSEVREDIEVMHESRLNGVYYNIQDWVEQSEQEVRTFSHTIEHYIPQRYFTEIEEGRFDGFHKKLLKSGLLHPNFFTEYVFTNTKGVIASSSNSSWLGKKNEYLQNISKKSKGLLLRGVYLPSNPRRSEPLSQYIILGSKIPRNGGFIYFLIAPEQKLNEILKRNFFANSGDVYMVNSVGEFITEGRWKEEFLGLNEDGMIQRNMMMGMPVAYEGKLILPAMQIKDRQRSSKGLHYYNNYLGKSVVGVWRWNGLYNFGVIVESSESESLSFINFYEKQNLLGILFTIFLIIVLTVLFILNRLRALRINQELKETYNIIKTQRDHLKKDLVLGQNIQMEGLPKDLYGDTFSLEAYLRPAMMVSGDFYDYGFLGESKEKLYFCIGDVSGKGVGAALFMSMAKVCLNKALMENTEVKDIVRSINQNLARNNQNCMFLTFILGIVDFSKGTVQITNAGHNPPYCKRENGKIVELDQVDGPLIGVFPDASFKQQNVEMSKGDVLFLYTDGVTESQDSQKNFYGDPRLKTFLEGSFESPKVLIQEIIKDVDLFAKGEDQFDDITMLALRQL